MSKVAVIKCTSYEREAVYQAVKKGISLIGGLEDIIPKSDRVLLKPNLVAGNSPDDAATTHPAVFEAVVRLFKEQNYNIKYGDSPGIGKPINVAIKCGLKEIADKYNIEFADFMDGEKISFKDGIKCKQFDIVNAVFESDSIVNLPKMKSHALARITGAVKNPFGCVLGYNKGKMHAKFTDAYTFSEMLIDLNRYLGVKLHIMDGIVAMEGNGPRNGTPTNMNVILVSKDPVALDSVFCKLVNVDPKSVPTITYGHMYNIGVYEDKEIELLGDNIEDLINKDFDVSKIKMDGGFNRSLKFLRKHALKKPVIIEDICRKCGICVKVCPIEPKAVTFVNNDRSTVPKYDYSKCIRCFCCQEMCPYDVIKVKVPLLGKILYNTILK